MRFTKIQHSFDLLVFCVALKSSNAFPVKPRGRFPSFYTLNVGHLFGLHPQHLHKLFGQEQILVPSYAWKLFQDVYFTTSMEQQSKTLFRLWQTQVLMLSVLKLHEASA